MSDLKSKRREVSSKINAIQKINETKGRTEKLLSKTQKEANEQLAKFDDSIENLQTQMSSTLQSFDKKIKKKLPNKDNIFEKLIRDFEKILPSKNGERQSSLFKITTESVNETSVYIKPLLIKNLRKLFFSSDGELSCGTSALMSVNALSISPKEFDYFNILQTDPESGLGKIMYEDSITSDRIKMNKEFYNTFATSPYTFQSVDNTNLFNLEWNVGSQKYDVSELTGKTVDEFITKYYESIEIPNISNILKNSMAMIMPVGGINTTNSTMDINMNKLLRVINKIMANCSPTNTSLQQNAISQSNESDINYSDYFDFDDVDGIDLDDENLRYEKVLKFNDCNNYKLSVDQDIIEDYAYGDDSEINPNDAYNDAIEKMAKTASLNNISIPFPNFLLNLIRDAIKNLPKSLLSAIFSPKIFFPIIVIWKMLRTVSSDFDIFKLIKSIPRFIFTFLKEIYMKFITIFWKKLKPYLILLLTKFVGNILKDSKKRYLRIIGRLIDVLTKVLPILEIGSCADCYNAILAVLNSLNVGAKQRIPGLLLQLSKQLPGYSENRATLNVSEYLESIGIPTGDLYGQPNNVVGFISAILKGHQDEMDDNSFVQISLDYAQLPVAPLGGAAFVPPGLVKGFGKLT